VDATALGGLLVGAGAVAGAVVAFVGKRSENAITGYSNLTGDLQEERDRLERQVTERDAKLLELYEQQRAADKAELERLRDQIRRLGGEP
jgi:hypothetical protein